MRLFIYELISAGALGADAPHSLRDEGAAMLTAIVADFERSANIEVVTLLAEDFPRSLGHRCRRVAAPEEPDAFRSVASQAVAALIIAPEFDDLLATRSQWALDAGCSLLGADPASIRLAGDKLALAQHLFEHGFRTPKTWRAADALPDDVPLPCVCKPRHGAGSQATFLVPGRSAWTALHRQARREAPNDELLLQAYHPGQPVSIAVLKGPRGTVVTPGATQRLSDDGRFRYHGGTTPLPHPLRRRASRWARAVDSVPGLLGYVGVDGILGAADDGSQDTIIEINPRLTTSYLGLRRLTDANLAEIWLRLRRGEMVEAPVWREEAVEFSAGGETQTSEV